ncbi:unnamed protein product [Arctogadus glacialis]
MKGRGLGLSLKAPEDHYLLWVAWGMQALPYNLQVSCARHLGASESVEAGLGGQIGCSNGGTVQNVTGADMSSLTPEE